VKRASSRKRWQQKGNGSGSGIIKMLEDIDQQDAEDLAEVQSLDSNIFSNLDERGISYVKLA